MISAIKIDVRLRTIVRVDMGTELQDFYFHIGCGVMEAVHPRWMDPRDRLYVDEEGLLTPGKQFFLIEGFGQPLAGNGLIVGHDEEGESVSAHAAFKDVWRRVKFLVEVST
jgi:hypothetical protein